MLKIMAPRDLTLRFVDDVIHPDPGKEYVLKAQATIDVSFNKDGSLNEKVLNQGISYGNSFVQSVADKRNWLFKLIDAFKYFFGLNAVKDISVPEKNNEKIQELEAFKM